MPRFLKAIPIAMAASLIALPAAAADQTVKVALLDMTAIWSPGAVGGNGAGPGMMGHGYGYGMMGGGYGAGDGPGQGGYGPAGQGPGGGYGPMMGGGMMGGMMSIRVNQSTVPAGKVTFDVTNLSRTVVHEMLVVAVDNANAPLPYDYNSWKVPEDQVKVIGETEEMEPNAEKTVELTLPAGTYLLICNIPGHYAAGMVTPLTVTP